MDEGGNFLQVRGRRINRMFWEEGGGDSLNVAEGVIGMGQSKQLGLWLG